MIELLLSKVVAFSLFQNDWVVCINNLKNSLNHVILLESTYFI